MDDKEFQQLTKKYSPLVKWIIESNQIYTGVDRTIRWQFSWDNNHSITAAVNRQTDLLEINIVFIDQAYQNNRLYEIEYFMLHEMRHIYQHSQIKLLDSEECAVDSALAKRWAREGENYITAVDKDGNENIGYYKQDCELDAYAFSFAVMSAKYKGIYDKFPLVPEVYKRELKEEYDSAVKEFLEWLK